MNSGDELSIENFVEMRKEDLNRFEKYWNENTKRNNPIFPSKLEEQDWEEQFRAYIDMVLNGDIL